jgi:hypothetical protein
LTRVIIFSVAFYTDLGESLTFRQIGSEETHNVGRYAAWAFKEGKNQVVETSDDLDDLKFKWGEAPVYCVGMDPGSSGGREG